MNNFLKNEVTTIAKCWKLSLKNGVILGFTDHSEDIFFQDRIFLAGGAVSISATETDATLAIDNLDLEAIIDNNQIKEADILGGVFDNAIFEVWLLDYLNPNNNMMLKTGIIGEIKISNGRFFAEIRGVTEKLTRQIGKVYSPSCRVKFGGRLCGMDISKFTFIGEISKVTSDNSFFDGIRLEENRYFDNGILKFETGKNAGLVFEVKEFFDKHLFLLNNPPFAMEIGDEYSVVAGCDKSSKICSDRFKNIMNFRGEPFIAGIEKTMV